MTANNTDMGVTSHQLKENDDLVLKVNDIHKSFAGTEVLKGVNLASKKGSVTSLLGSSGSGKSTFLRCINCLEIPEKGEVILNGESLAFKATRSGRKVSDQKQLAKFRSKLSMVFQGFNLWGHKTCLENIIESPVHVLNIPKKEAIESARYWLDKVGLSDKADAYPIQLSGGQQQRIGIARALAMNPDVILLDEPTSALDPELVGDVLKTIKKLAEEGRTMIIVTHEIQFAREVSDKIVFLHKGQIEEEATPEAFFNATSSPRVKQFLQNYLQGY